MCGHHRLLIILAIASQCLAVDQRKPKSIIDRLRIVDPDDTEYIKFEAAGDNKNTKKPNKAAEDDKPKTLSQQIADGKYALIQKEIFNKPPKRPGILSYDVNPEVPDDNIDNLGGLDKNEIWLAENHLLVLRGGSFMTHDDRRDHGESPWAPLDNYKAPLHQVKIPKNPKIPPPFPVQLIENGPLQILGTNSSRTINGTYEEALNAISPPDGYSPSSTIFQPYNTDSTNTTAWSAPMPIPGNSPPQGELPGGLPLPPYNLNGTLPPSLGYLPPGAVVLPPPGNQTDYIDYDDPSIYYPPPYSFYYPKDNSSAVPAGPLVPGIILPPPPDFFAPLEETTTVAPTRKPQRYRKPTTTQVTITITKSTTLLPTTKKATLPPKTVKIYPVKNHQYINEIRQTTTTARTPVKSVTVVPEIYTVKQRLKYQPTQRKKPGVTILRPVNPVITPSKEYVYGNEIPNKPFREYGPPDKAKLSVTTTAIPLRYHTDTNSVSEESGKRENLRRGKSSKATLRPAQYYYYNEQEKEREVPAKINSYVDNNEPYYVRPKPIASVRQRRPQYVYVTAKPYNTQKPRFRFIQQPVNEDTFNIHINKLKNQIQNYYTTPRTTFRTAPKPVYQFSFQAANYPSQQTNNFKPSPEINQQDQFQPVPAKYTVEIQQAIEIIPTQTPKYQVNHRPVFYQHTTERPYYSSSAPEFQQDIVTPRYQQDTVTTRSKYLQNVATPRPISEYSFEATPNPVYQGYYTKPDETYFDDRTKTYFTMFGRKIPSATTPIPRIVPRPSPQNNYQQRPVSLEGDTLVNYVRPRPNVNPDAEILPVDHPNYPNVVRYSPRPKDDSEIIKAIPIEVPSSETQDGSFISYQLPGDDGAHFYFLTPQLAQRKDQSAGFYYSKARRRRNEKTVDVDR